MRCAAGTCSRTWSESTCQARGFWQTAHAVPAAPADPRASKEFLLLAHLYARTDTASLAFLRRTLLRPKYTAKEVSLGAVAALSVAGGGWVALLRVVPGLPRGQL